MNNNDLTLIIVGLLIAVNMALSWTLGALQASSGQRIAELTMQLQRKPGHRRSGVIIPLHADYTNDSEA
ncbi:MAG: hypothetical protein EPO08_21310 [Rhodospirillaceae bacterium]|nr:MAG: hypothetical protein EPO08_21310 [Rhodospirillaceae bacterium]